MKKLGFGLMRLPQIEIDGKSVIDVELTKKMVDRFMSAGFTYFDTAWMYCDFESENVVKEALTSRYPRDSFTLATKLHSAFFNTVEEREDYFNTQLKKTGVDYFDYYLVHAINKEMYAKHTELDSFNWLIQKKADGLVKRIGFSFHDDAEFLDKVLTEHPEFEFVQLQINYLDWESTRVQSRLCYEVACKHNVPVIVMEPVKGGTLANLPKRAAQLFNAHNPTVSHASWAIRFAASLDNVFMVLSGMSNMEQLEDNVSVIDNLKPLTEADMSIYAQARRVIIEEKLVPCTACEYCLPVCPQNIQIPRLFSLYNSNRRVDAKDKVAFADIPSECIECGACKEVCPQKLDIPEHIKHINRFYS